MCVGSKIVWLQAGRGAAITQAMGNLSYGPQAITLLNEGIPPTQIIAALIASDEHPEIRQVAVVDAQGRADAFTGIGTIREAGHHVGKGYSVQANMMTHNTVIPAMAAAYDKARGDLAQRMLAALQAAQRAGGDIRGMQSAALKVVSGDVGAPAWASVYDLRVDEHANPIEELARLVRLRRAQIIDDEGYAALEKGKQEKALKRWARARKLAPELEELPFWQAVELADVHANVDAAAAILKPALADDPRQEHWLDLLDRLVACGLFKAADRAAALKAALD
jgi:uncharacterized Ntn-hydrolase superfamily protein